MEEKNAFLWFKKASQKTQCIWLCLHMTILSSVRWADSCLVLSPTDRRIPGSVKFCNFRSGMLSPVKYAPTVCWKKYLFAKVRWASGRSLRSRRNPEERERRPSRPLSLSNYLTKIQTITYASFHCRLRGEEKTTRPRASLFAKQRSQIN